MKSDRPKGNKYQTVDDDKSSSVSPVLIALICIAIVLVAVFYVRGWEHDKLHEDFNFSAETYGRLLESRLRDNVTELNSTMRFFQGSTFVSREEFSYYTKRDISMSGEIKSISWVPRVLAGQRRSLESSEWSSGLNGRTIHDHISSDQNEHNSPAPPRPIHFPILYLEHQSKTDDFIGFDLASKPSVLRLLEQARDEGIIVPITGFPSLHFEATKNEDGKSIVNLVQPVYRTTVPLKTIRQRRDNHLGFLVLQFNIGATLKEALLGIEPRGYDIYVVDVEADDGNEIVFHLHSQVSNEDIPALTYSELWKKSDFIHKSSLNISGRQWKIMMVPLPEYFQNNQQYQSWSVLVFGLLLSALFSYVLFMNQRQTDVIRDTVKIRTRELEFSETNKRAVIENIAEGIVTINGRGIIESFNPTSEKIFGYSSDEVVGRNVSMLMPPDERNAHEEYVRDSEIHASRIINMSRDLFGLRKDGSLFPMELNISPMSFDGEKKFVGIMHDISERKETADRLLLAKEEAEKANRAKSEFLSAMSHELRTPMNAILGFAQLMEYSPKEPLTEKQKSSVALILRGGNHLLELINQVLELSKIEAGKFSLNIDHVYARDVIDEALDMIRSRADREGIEIVDQTVGDDIPLLWTDKTRLIQVLLNLLSNAVKYNCEHGKVTLTFQKQGEQMLRICVADTGNGIPPEKQDDLFKPFERLGRESGRIEGSGIGLTITKQIIEMLGGQVGFDSEEGKGSTFWIDVPMSEKQDTNTVHLEVAKSTGKMIRKLNESGSQFTVLYVEDNPDNLQLMEMIIGRIGNTRLLSAYNAELGLDLAKSEQPDLILMDINLPGMNGIEALKQLQDAEETKDIPVIAITAAAMSKDVEAGLKAGFRDYITKPFNVPKFIRKIEEMLDSIEKSA